LTFLEGDLSMTVGDEFLSVARTAPTARRRVRRKLVVGAAIAFGVALAPGVAWADHCINVSRGSTNVTAWETQRGPWFYIAPDVGSFWVFETPENFQNGEADALLEGSKACSAPRLIGQTKGDVSIDALNGIWSEGCVDAALVDAGFVP
jgi:hypothetical protein